VDDGVDMVRYGVRSRVGGNRTLRVATYRTYGTATELRVMGRVLRDASCPRRCRATSWENLLATYRASRPTRCPGARVRITLGATPWRRARTTRATRRD
jgi:hypothetical protein